MLLECEQWIYFSIKLEFLIIIFAGGSRSPLPIFGPSGLIEKIHTSQNCQNNNQSCLDFSSLLCLNIAFPIFNQAKFSHHHFCRGVIPFLATPTSRFDRMNSYVSILHVQFSIKLSFLIIIFAGGWSDSSPPLPPSVFDLGSLSNLNFFLSFLQIDHTPRRPYMDLYT